MPLEWEEEEEEFGNLLISVITSPSHITYCVVLQFKPELPYQGRRSRGGRGG